MSQPADRLGKPINDPRALAAFGAWAACPGLIRDLHKLRRAAIALAMSADGHLVNTSRLETEFRNIVAELRFAQPYTTCPMRTKCDAACRFCRGTQWVSEKVWDRIPQEYKR